MSNCNELQKSQNYDKFSNIDCLYISKDDFNIFLRFKIRILVNLSIILNIEIEK